MMEMFQDLLGGGRRDEYQDFVRRYEAGPPWDGISEQEVGSYYGQMSSRLPPDVYEEAAQEAFARLSPQERMQFVQYVQSRARSQQMDMRDLDFDGQPDMYEDPRRLARVTSRMQQRQPDLLGGLLGGGGGGGSLMGNPIAKAALGGIVAMAAKRMIGGR